MIEFLMYEPVRERSDVFRASMKAIFLSEKSNYSLSTFFSRDALLKAFVDKPSKYDVVLISLDDEDVSMNIAKSVRARNTRLAIIFCGNDLKKLCRMLPFRPSALLQDTYEEAHIKQTILTVYKEQNELKEQIQKRRYFLVRNRDELERIPYAHIDYFESSSRKVYLHSNKSERVYEFNAKLDDVIAAIKNADFVRCHQSCLVNIANVQRIDKTARQFVMFSGKTVDISKRSIADAALFFEKYALSVQ